MKLKIFYLVFILFLAIFFLLLTFPFFCCRGNYKLSKVEYKEMIEQANQGNDTAMMKLGNHYIGSKAGMYAFYQYKVYETRYSLLDDEYKQLSEYIETTNETAKEKLKKYQWVLDEKKELYNFLDSNTTRMQLFIQFCSLDDFCNSSDIYKHYSQKVSNINDFMELLTRNSEPTAYEYSKFVGGGGNCGGEPEMDFNYRECKSKDLELNSKECQKISVNDCYLQPSKHLKWLREHYKTIGADYKVLSIQQKLDKDKKTMDYEIIEVVIGNNQFTLLHNLYDNPPYLFWIVEINNKDIGDLIDEYLKNQQQYYRGNLTKQ
ncbi:MAG: hypothetical protein LBL65_08730 [Campylobacteraceae bacterium]|nr:hypothetical protein [Campylobacteraceae bacterium]